jgi:hypothetical protein
MHSDHRPCIQTNTNTTTTTTSPTVSSPIPFPPQLLGIITIMTTINFQNCPTALTFCPQCPRHHTTQGVKDPSGEEWIPLIKNREYEGWCLALNCPTCSFKWCTCIRCPSIRKHFLKTNQVVYHYQKFHLKKDKNDDDSEDDSDESDAIVVKTESNKKKKSKSGPHKLNNLV